MSVTMPKFLPMSRLSLSVMCRTCGCCRPCGPRVGIVAGDFPSVAGEVEVEEVSLVEERSGAAHEQVALELGTEPSALDEPDRGRGDFEPPAELGVAVVGAGSMNSRPSASSSVSAIVLR